MPLPPFLRRPAVPLASVALLAAVALPGLSTTAVATPTRPALPLPAAAPLQTVQIEVPSAPISPASMPSSSILDRGLQGMK